MKYVKATSAHWRDAIKLSLYGLVLFSIKITLTGNMQILIDVIFVKRRKIDLGNQKQVNVLVVECIGVFLKSAPLKL